jgi:hypothetical protein
VSGKLSQGVALTSTGALPENVNYAIKSNYLLELIATERRINVKIVASQPKSPVLPENPYSLILLTSCCVAFVYGSSPSDIAGTDPPDPRARAFVHGLRDLGLVDGRNIAIERRAVEGRPERLPALMQQVVWMGVDVIVTLGGPGVTAAQRATDRIAIVGVVDSVVDTGLVDSLARPGRNLTGIGENSAAIHGKRLQILKETAPATLTHRGDYLFCLAWPARFVARRSRDRSSCHAVARPLGWAR